MGWRETEVAGSDLSPRARNMLVREGLTTAGAVSDSELARIPEVGVQTRREILGWLTELQSCSR